MALRREEDREAARSLGVDNVSWLGFPEAPHRGYGSARALFSSVRNTDDTWTEILGSLDSLIGARIPEVVFAPQALGGHVDHLQVVRAVRALSNACPVIWYRDTPYAIREPAAQPSPLLPKGLEEVAADVAGVFEAKLDACAAYATQLGFQFGGEGSMRHVLTQFASAEARRLRFTAPSAEALLVPGCSTSLVEKLRIPKPTRHA